MSAPLAADVQNPQRRFTVQRYYKKCKCASIASIIHKKDRFIYLIHYPPLAQACLKAKSWIMDDEGEPF